MPLHNWSCFGSTCAHKNNDGQEGKIEKLAIKAPLKGFVVIVPERIIIGDVFKFDNFQSE